MKEKLKQATKEIAQHRSEVIDKLVQFAVTDMLLFWGQEKDLIARQEKVWAPIIAWSNYELNTKFITTHGLDVPEQHKTSNGRLKAFLEQLSDKELAAFYLAALDMRSVLLAAALVKGHLNAEEVYEAAFLEELWQAENWGIDEEAEEKRRELKAELEEIEDFLKTK